MAFVCGAGTQSPAECDLLLDLVSCLDVQGRVTNPSIVRVEHLV